MRTFGPATPKPPSRQCTRWPPSTHLLGDANAQGLDIGYLVDWDSSAQTTSNWRPYSYRDRPLTSVISHFEVNLIPQRRLLRAAVAAARPAAPAMTRRVPLPTIRCPSPEGGLRTPRF